MVKDLSFDDPCDFYSVLNRRLWFEDGLNLIGPRMAKERAAVLFKAGMQVVRDVWDLKGGQLYDWDEIRERFPLMEEERPFWRQLTKNFPRYWSCKLRIEPLPLKKGEWVGLFQDNAATIPSTVFKITSASLNLVKSGWSQLSRQIDTHFYSVGIQFQTLHWEESVSRYMRLWDACNTQLDMELGNEPILSGVVKRVRVLLLSKERKVNPKYTTLLYYGPVANLTFDPKNYS
jgi:hypothetical protein